MFNMYYQLEYDKVMIVDPFYYKEKDIWVNGLSLFLRFDPIFQCDPTARPKEQVLQLPNDSVYLFQLVKVSYDKKKKVISFHEREEIKGKYKVVSYYMDTCPKPLPFQEPTEEEKRKMLEAFTNLMDNLDKGILSEYGLEEISEKEFYFIVNKYGEFIANDTSLQTCSYSWHEVKNLPEGAVIQSERKSGSITM